MWIWRNIVVKYYVRLDLNKTDSLFTYLKTH